MATSMVDISPTADGSLGELEDSIKMALKKPGSMKKLDLCAYLSNDDRPFPPSAYLMLKDTDRKTLLNMIKTEILDRYPHRVLQKAQETSNSPYAGKSLEECLKEAITKMNVLRETALCKYLPRDDEGYLHHFTFLKMKSVNPIQLRNLIKEHILDCTPMLIPPKKRHRRQPRELPEDLPFARPPEGDDHLDSVII